MRLDKFLASSGECSRSEAQKAARRGDITVNGNVVRDASSHINESADAILWRGRRVLWRPFRYIMLNKPAGYVSSTDDAGPTVMELLPPEFTKLGLAPCGRLDRDTVGLLLITNDGAAAHALLSPKKHVSKRYRYRLSDPLGEEGAQRIRTGIDLGDFTSKPALLYPEGDLAGEIAITEGKFHQIKRMFHAVGTEIVFLERIAFGPLVLDPALSRGEWRELTDDETDALNTAAGRSADLD